MHFWDEREFISQNLLIVFYTIFSGKCSKASRLGRLTKPRWGGVWGVALWGVGLHIRDSPNNRWLGSMPILLWDTSRSERSVRLSPHYAPSLTSTKSGLTCFSDSHLLP